MGKKEMKKGKLLGIKNYEDVIWLRISPDDDTIGLLAELFEDMTETDLFDPVYHGNEEKKYKDWKEYYKWVGEGNRLECEEGAVVDMVFSEKVLHILIRKVGEWEKVKNKFLEYFEIIE